MATFVKLECVSEHLLKGGHALQTHDLYLMLTSTTPNVATHDKYADFSAGEANSSSGYTTGGYDTANGLSRTGAVTSITGTDTGWTITGSALSPAVRYAVLFNNTSTTPVTKPAIGYWDYGSGGFTLNVGDAFTFDIQTTLFTQS